VYGRVYHREGILECVIDPVLPCSTGYYRVYGRVYPREGILECIISLRHPVVQSL